MLEDKTELALIGAAAALLAHIMHLCALAFAEPPPTRAQWIRAGVEGLVSIIAGTAAAVFVSPSVAQWELFGFHLDSHAAAFLVGFTAWRMLPVLLRAAQNWLDIQSGGRAP